jgi:hypothetical protein
MGERQVQPPAYREQIARHSRGRHSRIPGGAECVPLAWYAELVTADRRVAAVLERERGGRLSGQLPEETRRGLSSDAGLGWPVTRQTAYRGGRRLLRLGPVCPAS